MKKVEVSEDDRDEIARCLRTARLSLAALELALSSAGLGSSKGESDKQGLSFNKIRSTLTKGASDESR